MAQAAGSRLSVTAVRLTAAERARLDQAASRQATTISDLIRQALRREGVLPALDHA